MTPSELADAATVHRDDVVRWARSYVPPAAVEDVAQAALLALVEHGAAVDRDKVSPWLRVAVWRQARIHRRRDERLVLMSPPERVEPAPDPEVALANREMSAEVRAAVARLPPSRRKIVVAVLGNETSIAAVAAVEGVPESTARRRLADGADDLRGDLERERERERRRSRGFTSWAAMLGLMDLRAWARRAAALGAAAAGGVLITLATTTPDKPPPDELPVAAFEADPLSQPAVAWAERGVERRAPVRERTRHDAGQRFRAERFGAP